MLISCGPEAACTLKSSSFQRHSKMPVHQFKSNLRLSRYFSDENGEPYADLEHQLSLPATGVFLTEQKT